MMKNFKYILLAVVLFPLMGIVSSCSEDSETEGEFDNWQVKNDAYVDKLAASSMTRYLTYTKNSSISGALNSDYVYVEVLESGSGTETPLFTDTVRVAYRGRLIPSKSYNDGYVFDQTFLGDFDWNKASAYDSMTGSFVDGFTTALMNMHKGDRWRIYLPYSLGYDSSSTTYIPAYSDLVFEVALYDFWHPGETRPVFKSREI